MQPRILVTNGGPHPADKWAALTADMIGELIQVDESSSSPAAVAARKAKPRFILEVAELLEGYHAEVQKHERELLAAGGDDRLVAPLDPHGGPVDTPLEAAEAIAAVAAKYGDTPIASHFGSDAIKAIVAGMVADHHIKIMDIERSWHADRNPSELATAYQAARRTVGPRHVHLHLLGGQAEKRRTDARKGKPAT